MLHRGRPAHLLLALLIMTVPVSLAEAKAPSAPAASRLVRAPGASATTATTPATTPATPVAPPAPPATTSAAAPVPPAPAPVIVTTPQQVLAGASAVLQIQNPPAGATDYRWDLDGSGSFATDTGALAHVSHVFATPGLEHLTVRITTATGTRTATLDVRVAPGAGSASHAAHAGARLAPAGAGLLAHTSSDPADTISDFVFTPASLTVHVGDTITWTNNGPAPHSATAYDHSFDTGILKKGQSASHTFTTAGTFTYFCTVHPYMHGTVVVLASSSSGSTDSGSSGSGTSSSSGSGGSTSGTSATGSNTGTGSTNATTASGSTLPLTGLNLVGALGAAALLIGAGVVLRSASRRGDLS